MNLAAPDIVDGPGAQFYNPGSLATLSPGTRLGPYQVTALLGAGGMGEVYKATDTRLNRTVAIKVLAGHVAPDPQRRDRFEREAKTLASLSHPNICPIHDVGSVDGTDYLVMECLDGQTLADRLTAGQLPLEKALETAIEIADALDAAHRAGIVHRDLKPGNIMLTRSGAKLLDFGLAKATGVVASEAGGSILATTVADLTAAGVILGTFPYMAPEQIEGGEADARTDVFALGAVLFEMLTGRRAFEGHSAASLMGAILNEVPPPISSALAARNDRFVDPRDLHHLDYTVGRCLAKDPNDRWQSARDLVLHLRWIAENRSKTAALTEAAAPPRIRHAAPWILAILALTTSLGLAWVALQRATPRVPVVRFSIDPPADAVFAPTNWISAPHPSVSPDGRYVAFLAQVGTEPVRLWVRALDSVEARPLDGTDGASFPFWSADSRLLGFFAEGSLKTVDLLGGAAHRVCSAPAGEGGTWNREGTILFAPGTSGGLYRVSAGGGVPTAVTTPSPSRGSAPHRWPSFLPDGRRFVFHEGDGISLGTLDTNDVRFLIEADSQAVYSAAGYLLFVRGWTLLAQPFDATRGTVSGEPRPIAEGISRALNNAAFSVSETGALIYRSGRLVNRQLTWFDRSGKPIGSVGGVHDFNGVHLSPDERRVAYHRHDGRANGDVWIVDIVRGNSERVTLNAENLSPVWSPDGAQLAYASNRASGVNNLWIKPSNGTAGDTLLLASTVNKTPRSWSPDGMFIAYVSTGGRGDIWILPLSGSRTPVPFAQTDFDERDPMFSPNGRWLAYQSDESGHNEVYVRPFPGGEGRWMISTGGGATPKWRGDGRELFYQLNREIWAVAISPVATGLEVGTPQRVLDIGAGSSGWDVARDGQRILVGRGVEDRAPGALTVTINWAEALRN